MEFSPLFWLPMKKHLHRNRGILLFPVIEINTKIKRVNNEKTTSMAVAGRTAGFSESTSTGTDGRTGTPKQCLPRNRRGLERCGRELRPEAERPAHRLPRRTRFRLSAGIGHLLRFVDTLLRHPARSQISRGAQPLQTGTGLGREHLLGQHARTAVCLPLHRTIHRERVQPQRIHHRLSGAEDHQ